MKNGDVSFWWDSIGRPERRAALPSSLHTDVAIVGAGYTGLWTAYYLQRANPALRITILDQEFAGYGASGRNGGWLTNTITGGRDQYIATHGRDSAVRFQTAMNDSVTEVIDVAAAEGINADIARGGELTIACNEAQESRLRRYITAEQGWPNTDVESLSAANVASRIAVSGARYGLWHPHCARIQPAKLVDGLARVVEKRGATIYEGTHVSAVQPHQVQTAFGTVSADYIVRATEGFTAGLQGLKRQWLPMNSSLIVTEVLPDSVWNEIGWDGCETLGDMAHAYMYAQRTQDDRIALGGRGKPYRYGSGTDSNGRTPTATIAQLREILHRFFPSTIDCALEHAWSGVLGVPRDWSATVGLHSPTGMAWAGGYVGTGVTTANLAGRTLADLIVGADSELIHLPWVGHKVRPWEPEPLRWLAVHALYAAYYAADRAEVKRSTTSPLARIADRISGR